MLPDAGESNTISSRATVVSAPPSSAVVPLLSTASWLAHKLASRCAACSANASCSSVLHLIASSHIGCPSFLTGWKTVKYGSSELGFQTTAVCRWKISRKAVCSASSPV